MIKENIEYYTHPDAPGKVFFRNEAPDFFDTSSIPRSIESYSSTEDLNARLVSALYTDIGQEVQESIEQQRQEELDALKPKNDYSTFSFFLILCLFIGVEMTAQSVYDALMSAKRQVFGLFASVTENKLSYAHVFAVVATLILFSTIGVVGQKAYATATTVAELRTEGFNKSAALADAVGKLATMVEKIESSQQTQLEEIRRIQQVSQDKEAQTTALISVVEAQNKKLDQFAQTNSANAQKIALLQKQLNLLGSKKQL
jgi:hypothetical protein